MRSAYIDHMMPLAWLKTKLKDFITRLSEDFEYIIIIILLITSRVKRDKKMHVHLIFRES